MNVLFLSYLRYIKLNARTLNLIACRSSVCTKTRIEIWTIFALFSFFRCNQKDWGPKRMARYDNKLQKRSKTPNSIGNLCQRSILGIRRTLRTSENQSAWILWIFLQSSWWRTWACRQIDYLYVDAWRIDRKCYQLDYYHGMCERFFYCFSVALSC